MTTYKSWRIIDGKPRLVIVDENRNVINRKPSKEELKGLEVDIHCKKRYNDTNTCDMVYIFPKDEIKKRSSITIYKNPISSHMP